MVSLSGIFPTQHHLNRKVAISKYKKNNFLISCLAYCDAQCVLTTAPGRLGSLHMPELKCEIDLYCSCCPDQI